MVCLTQRLALALLLALALAWVGVGAALAQSAACPALNSMLQQLEANPGLQQASRLNEDLTGLQVNERNAERAYLRAGCQSDQQRGLPQTPQCRAFASQILAQRAQISQLSQSAGNTAALAQQRQNVLNQMNRYGCTPDSSGASFSGYGAPPPQAVQRRNFLQQLFGGVQRQDNYGGYNDNYNDGYGDNQDQYNGQQVQDPWATQQPQQDTIRTVCVRLSDGYYWPISFSTTRDYIPEDAQACEAQCPNQQVALYFYDNPGQDPSQMVDTAGEPYTDLPTAFAYRKNFDQAASCQPPQTVGSVQLGSAADGLSRAVVSYGGEQFPLPQRDPRLTEEATPAPTADVATIDIPLPRPRPGDPGATGPKPKATAPPTTVAKTRIVRIGNKLVRIVGPETPYAQPTGPAG